MGYIVLLASMTTGVIHSNKGVLNGLLRRQGICQGKQSLLLRAGNMPAILAAVAAKGARWALHSSQAESYEKSRK